MDGAQYMNLLMMSHIGYIYMMLIHLKYSIYVDIF